MPTVLSGLVDTEDVLGDERVVDMSEEIAYLDPDTTQFTTMLNRIGTKDAIREKVNWLEDELFPRISALATSATSATTTWDVTAGEGTLFRAGDIVRNAATGEAVRVTSISTDALTVVRTIGDVAAASAASGTQLVIVGNAAAQGATLGTRKMTKKVLGYNYTQIFRHPFGFTNTNVAIERYGGSEPDVEAKKKLVEHKRAIEQSLFWGARDFITSGNEPIGVMGGLDEFVTTNVDDAGGTLTEANLDTYLRDGLQHGPPDSSVIFAAPLVMQAISGFLRDNITKTTGKDRLWGAKVDAYISGAYGTNVPVMVKKEWNDFSSASDQYGGWAFGVNMDNVKLRPLRTRNTKLLPNRQANDADETTHEYLTEVSCEIRIEKSHFVIVGVTG
jgi:hypothetical protein